jgi:hypothetical protein
VNEQRPPTASSLLLYQSEDGQTRVQCRFEGETLWLTQVQMAELFQTTTSNINIHLKVIFEERELDPAATIKSNLMVRTEGKREVRREVLHYSLPAVLAVGYRVRSHRGTQFRQWATARLTEFMTKGFVMDDDRLKNPPGPGQRDYFDELLERIRDICSSERRFYQKVLDIYATSVDYQPDSELAQRFFATVQNKMYWAAHGHTAAELIHARADAQQPLMGLTSTVRRGVVRREDVAVAKNYLKEDELQVLNRVVSLYLEYAELQALNRTPMAMKDWISKLDEFLKIAGREVLTHAGTVSADAAKARAMEEFTRYRKALDAQPRDVDLHFEKAVKGLTQVAKLRPGTQRMPKRGKGRS